MRIAVLGLWHLGSVTSACLAAAGHDVAGWDPDAATVAALQAGAPPVAEPGLADLVAQQLAAGRLRFTAEPGDAVAGADVVWIAFDTPVDADDRADVDFVIETAAGALRHVKDDALVVCSSQLPVGSVARLERETTERAPGHRVLFVSAPENLRLGKAIEVFTRPDRVIAGVRGADAGDRFRALMAPITDRIELMSVESAEMTKHAINAFLATSVTFINELAGLCERVGADAREVERGLKTESRIGPKAYLVPGAAFAGGTLARDVVFLRDLGRRVNRATPLMDGVESSNRAHREWAIRRLEQELGSLSGRTIAVWGLTYKAGTDTLRRSTAVELCQALVARGASVRVHDPAVGTLPGDFPAVQRTGTPLDAASGADALVVATEWPEYRAVTPDAIVQALPAGLVLDPNGFLRALATDARLRVIAVGTAAEAAR